MSAPQPARTTRLVVPFAATVGIILLVSAIVNAAFGAQFPSNAPVEWLYMVGITIDLAVAGLILVIRASRNRGRALLESPSRPAPLAIVGAILALVAFLSYLLIGGLVFVSELIDGVRLRYMEDVFGAFLAGGPWVLGIVFGVAGYRRTGGRVNSVLSIGAVVLGLLVAVGVVASSIIYGLGLSD